MARPNQSEVGDGWRLRMLCLMCKSEHKKLVKAHIIPESLYAPILKDGITPLLHSNIEGHHNKRIRKGVYDKNILCDSCEKLFSPYDTYAKEFFLGNRQSWKTVTNYAQTIGHVTTAFNYTKLKLFFISLIYRASLSSHNFFKRIDLGELQDHAKEMIVSGNPGTPDEFSIIISEFDHKHLSTAMLDPHRVSIQGVDFFIFYFSGFCPIIKVDASQTPIELAPLQLGQEAELTIPTREFLSSKELPIIKSMRPS